MFGKMETIGVVIVVIAVLFGSKKIPELAKNIGSSVNEMRKGFRGELSDNKAEDKTIAQEEAPRFNPSGDQ